MIDGQRAMREKESDAVGVDWRAYKCKVTQLQRRELEGPRKKEWAMGNGQRAMGNEQRATSNERNGKRRGGGGG